MASEGLARRSQRLVVIDVDSTLITDEVIDLVAAEAGVGEEVAENTRLAMEGALTSRSRCATGSPCWREPTPPCWTGSRTR